MIEPGDAGARRHRDPQVVPQPLARELQLLHRRSEHVLDDDEAGARRDDQPLGRDEAVRDVACILVQQRDRGHELAQQAQRRVEIERQPRACATRSISDSRIPST